MEVEETGLGTAENMQGKNYTSRGFYGCVPVNDRAGPSHPVGTFGEGKREPNKKRLN